MRTLSTPRSVSLRACVAATAAVLVAVDGAGNASPPSNARTVHIDWGAGCE